jgi:hypothetical protein
MKIKKDEKLPYSVGDWMVVPFLGKHFALGLIARASVAGIILGYFFRPKGNDIPSAVELNMFEPKDAIAIRILSDKALLEGRWRIIGHICPWSPDKWPMPLFAHKPALEDNVIVLREYNEAFQFVKETRIDEKQAKNHPKDGFLSDWAVELLLTYIIEGPRPQRKRNENLFPSESTYRQDTKYRANALPMTMPVIGYPSWNLARDGEWLKKL